MYIYSETQTLSDRGSCQGVKCQSILSPTRPTSATWGNISISALCWFQRGWGNCHNQTTTTIQFIRRSENLTKTTCEMMAGEKCDKSDQLKRFRRDLPMHWLRQGVVHLPKIKRLNFFFPTKPRCGEGDHLGIILTGTLGCEVVLVLAHPTVIVCLKIIERICTFCRSHQSETLNEESQVS